MTLHGEVTFRRKSFDDGFGFACMKAAYQLGITGRMDYNSETGAKIIMEGDGKQLNNFLEWIKKNFTDVSELLFSATICTKQAYKEFDIYRH